MDRSKMIYAGPRIAYNVMLKPFGPICNLDCDYCYYLEKKNLYMDEKKFVMSEELLEKFFSQYFKSQDVPAVSVVWQGGEPTMLGVDYFKRAMEIIDKHNDNKQIEHVFQTNGTLIDEEWARFFKRHDFLVGVSIDGPKELHDKYRTYKDGTPTWDRIMKGIGILKKHDVRFNTLTVVNDLNSHHPLEVYHFLKEIGSGYMQFIPIVERIADSPGDYPLKLVAPHYGGGAKVAPWSVEPKQMGDFLIQIFDEWVRNDVGKYFVQHFDVMLANWVGERPGLCAFSKTCGDATAMEFNGDLFACDHFVYPEDKLGNIMEKDMIHMVQSERQMAFGEAKQNSLPQQCLDCDYRFACNGGCPKNRIIETVDGEPGLNYLCEGYYNFYKHIHPYMQFMADELEKKRAPANVMDWVRKMDFRKSIRSKGNAGGTPIKPSAKQQSTASAVNAKIGRNDPCPCGSGKKYKNCCMFSV